MAKEFYVLSKQSSHQCFSSLGNFESIQQVNDSSKWEEIRQSRSDLMKKYLQQKTIEAKSTTLSTYQSQKVLVPKLENAENKLISKLGEKIIKPKDKENLTQSSQKQQEKTESLYQKKRDKSVYDRLYNLRDVENKSSKPTTKNTNENEQRIQTQKVFSNHNVLIEKRSSDPSVLMPISSLIRKSQKQHLPQKSFINPHSSHLFEQQQIDQRENNKNLVPQSKQENYQSEDSQPDLWFEVEQQQKQPKSTFPVKHCFFSLVQENEKLQNKKVRSLSNEKFKQKQNSKQSKNNRAHTQGRQDSKNQNKINRLYEYILEGNY